MCLIVFALKTHPDYKLILAANRDEFYERPTTVADWWKDQPRILGGRDLKAKGTWMGVASDGKFAAVTNYRDLSNIREDAKSRGDLPVDFLKGAQSSLEYSEEIVKAGSHYNGFNLLTLDEEMVHVSNYENKVNALEEGIYGLSNALLDTPWPKVERAKSQFKDKIAGDFTLKALLDVMDDTAMAKDTDLPETGLPIEMERAVSAMHIKTPTYGTCCSTVITIDYDGQVEFIERSFPVGERKDGLVSYKFQIEG